MFKKQFYRTQNFNLKTMNNLPTYTLKIADNEQGMTAISLVEYPAIEENFLFFSKQLKFVENKKFKQILTGPVTIPNIPIYRKYKNEEFNVIFEAEVIEEMVIKFFKEKRNDKFTINHKNKVSSVFIFESWIIADANMDKAKSLGFDLPKGTFMISCKIEDEEIFNAILNGDYKGFSLESFLNLVEIDFSSDEIEIEIDEDIAMECIFSLAQSDISNDEFEEYFQKFAKVKKPTKKKVKVDNSKWIWMLRDDQRGRKPLLNNSRDFCKRNVNKVFTKDYILTTLEDELQKEPTVVPDATFENFWKQKLVIVDGEKKSPFMFNCAHNWFPVSF